MQVDTTPTRDVAQGSDSDLDVTWMIHVT
jgi:hypothetical protein